jgi:aspartate aminotransferase
VGVAAVPGDAFFAPGFVRFSFACSMAVVERGVARVGEALAALR